MDDLVGGREVVDDLVGGEVVDDLVREGVGGKCCG